MIRNIPIWRWLVVAALFFGSALSDFSYLSYNSPVAPTTIELLTIQTNTEITFKLMLIFLLVAGDLWSGEEYKKILREQTSFKGVLVSFRTAVLICMLFFGTMLVIRITVYFLIAGFRLNFTNRWITVSDMPNTLAPFAAMGVSILLVFLRFLFFSSVIQVINIKSKNSIGFIGVFAICLLDVFGYSNLRLQTPTGFLPFEHSYLQMVMKLSPNFQMSIIYSVLYWVLLIAIILTILMFIIRSKRSKKKVAIV